MPPSNPHTLTEQNGRVSHTLDQPCDLIDPSPDPLPDAERSIEEETWFYGTRDLLDTLPQVWTRGLLYFLVVFAAILLPWAVFSKVDETGTSRGRLEPKGVTSRLDAPIAGTVAAIKVKEGQTIKAGQPLLEIESEVPRAELQQAEARLEGQRNRLTQLELIKNQLEMTVRTQRLQNQAQRATQQAQVDQTRQQLKATQADTNSIQQLLDRDQGRVGLFQDLKQNGIVSGLQVDEAERKLMETQQRLQKSQSDIEQAQSELQKQQSGYTKGLREGELILIDSQRRLQELQVQIAEVQADMVQAQTQIQTLSFQLKQRVVRAPIAGTIFQLPIKNAGAVVQPGSQIAQIAPKNTPLVLRAQISSQESGFLRLGMPAKIKFDAYPFQDYGVIEGRVTWISPDSKVKETNLGQTEVFDLEITIARPYIQTPTRKIALTPGQTATAEVIVRQRHVIDYILDPFKKLQASGLKL